MRFATTNVRRPSPRSIVKEFLSKNANCASGAYYSGVTHPLHFIHCGVMNNDGSAASGRFLLLLYLLQASGDVIYDAGHNGTLRQTGLYGNLIQFIEKKLQLRLD